MATVSADNLHNFLGTMGLKTPVPAFESANMTSRPLDIGRSYLADVLLGLLEGEDPVKAYNSIQWSNDTASGDLYVPIPKINHGEGDAEDLAFDLMQKFPQDHPLFVLPVPDGVLLRIFFNSRLLPRLLVPYIKDRGAEYGKVLSNGLRDPTSPDSGKLKVVVEFSSPNIITEFQAAHLRSTLLGAYVSNLYENMGWDVVRINYLGDWGQHIGLFGAGWARFGTGDEIGDYRSLTEVYTKVNEPLKADREEARKSGAGSVSSAGADGAQAATDLEPKVLIAEREEFFKSMEARDEAALKLWSSARQVSVEEYERVYERLNVRFDEYSGESQVTPELMAEVEEILKRKGLSEERDGSVVVDLKKHNLKGTGIIRKNGCSTYFLRDLAAAVDRFRRFDFDRMVYVVSVDQEPHFAKVVKTIELMDDEFAGLSKKLHPLYFGRVSQASEKLRSSGHLGDILDEAQQSMKESLAASVEEAAALGSTDETAAAMGISALLAQEMAAKRVHDHSFDITKMTSFELGTGPHIQYTFARAKAALQKAAAGEDGLDGLDLSTLTIEARKLTTPCPYTELLRLLVQYPDVTTTAYKTMEPSPIMGYLQNVTSQVARCLDEGQAEGESFSGTQLAILTSAVQVLENGMRLLGILPLTV
ncbi:related to arginyl-tRNA synthetase, cytosolic [Cephalotrichum gorgonifer]|uniref:arginine--tRNA ligase n=1 Tax=Cephalotrichum gorgonifer TaxID=2041049 RepID=A0AAE8N0F8_9PEZI|nr:related to arginyl-tRNA synthetase, cytosolic [Cephalotrichum gorgonifer]